MSQLLLRDVGELIIFIVREVVARVVLDNTECIFAVNVARAVCIDVYKRQAVYGSSDCM